MLARTKTLDLADYAPLQAVTYRLLPESVLEGQHPHREWEYRMALATRESWRRSLPRPDEIPLHVLDVGGGGSRFWEVFDAPRYTCTVVDPERPPAGGGAWVKALIDSDDPAIPAQVDAIFAISVIEHTEHPRTFLAACAKRLVAGGLLFLTADCWDCEGPDVAHFNWMRQRIFNIGSWRKLLDAAREHGLVRFGEADWHYHGDHVYNYSFISGALVKIALEDPDDGL